MSGKEEAPEISPVLFLDTGGQPMRFYVRPGPTKVQLHPLITNGGGTVCRIQEPGAILLIDPAEVSSAMASSGLKYISFKYVTDCVEQGQQLDLEDYVISVGPSVQTRMASRHQGNGRLGYSPEEDAAILKFMENRQQEAKGNTVWKEMQKQQVTEHSWQSMKDRFLKHLQHKLVYRKSPSKRKPLFLTQSPLRKRKVTSEPESDSIQKSDSSETQISSEDSSCPNISANPPASPEKAASPPLPPEASHSSSNGTQEESCLREQEMPAPETSRSCRSDEDQDGEAVENEPNEHSSPKKTREGTCQTSTSDSKSCRSDEDLDAQDVAKESNEHSSPKNTENTTFTTSTSDSKISTLDEDRNGEDIAESNEQSSSQKTREESCKTSTSELQSSRLNEEQVGQDIPNGSNDHSSPNKTGETTCETSTPEPRSPRTDEDQFGQDISDGINEHSTPNKTRKATSKSASTPDSRKLGILAKAAREFEDSDVMDESEEGESQNEAIVPSIVLSNTHEGSASEKISRDPETHNLHEEDPPEEEEVPPSSTSHISESEETPSLTRRTPEETRSRKLSKMKENVLNLMSDTQKDLVEVTKALLKASGDFSKARVFLLDGYNNEKHGPLWTRMEDEILLLDDPYELEQLHAKFGEEEVTRRRAFLTADGN